MRRRIARSLVLVIAFALVFPSAVAADPGPQLPVRDPDLAGLTQSGHGGRYTFMGDLNPLAIFRTPAAHC